MPRLCSGYDMGSNGSLHPCRFALDGRGHSAQARPCGKCIFCNDESMRAAVATPQGFGSVVRALKKWRVMSSPIYDLAFECSSLTSLPAAQLEALRGSAQDLVRKSNPNQPPQKTGRRKKRVVAQSMEEAGLASQQAWQIAALHCKSKKSPPRSTAGMDSNRKGEPAAVVLGRFPQEWRLLR